MWTLRHRMNEGTIEIQDLHRGVENVEDADECMESETRENVRHELFDNFPIQRRFCFIHVPERMTRVRYVTSYSQWRRPLSPTDLDYWCVDLVASVSGRLIRTYQTARMNAVDGHGHPYLARWSPNLH